MVENVGSEKVTEDVIGVFRKVLDASDETWSEKVPIHPTDIGDPVTLQAGLVERNILHIIVAVPKSAEQIVPDATSGDVDTHPIYTVSDIYSMSPTNLSDVYSIRSILNSIYEALSQVFDIDIIDVPGLFVEDGFICKWVESINLGALEAADNGLSSDVVYGYFVARVNISETHSGRGSLESKALSE